MLKRVILIVALCTSTTLALAQQPEPQPQPNVNPCVHGASRVVLSGIDMAEMRCQLALAASRIGELEFEMIQLRAKNLLLQNDADAAEKARSSTPTKEPPNAQQIPHDGGSGAQSPVRQEGGGPH